MCVCVLYIYIPIYIGIGSGEGDNILFFFGAFSALRKARCIFLQASTRKCNNLIYSYIHHLKLTICVQRLVADTSELI